VAVFLAFHRFADIVIIAVVEVVVDAIFAGLVHIMI